MGVSYLNEQERDDLQEDTGSSLRSVHDLRELYYQGKLGLAGTANAQETELIRSYLISQTGATGVRSIHDLWVLYLVAQGITYHPSLGDMMREFFGPVGNTGGGNPGNNQGLFIGLPFGLTYAS